MVGHALMASIAIVAHAQEHMAEHAAKDVSSQSLLPLLQKLKTPSKCRCKKYHLHQNILVNESIESLNKQFLAFSWLQENVGKILSETHRNIAHPGLSPPPGEKFPKKKSYTLIFSLVFVCFVSLLILVQTILLSVMEFK